MELTGRDVGRLRWLIALLVAIRFALPLLTLNGAWEIHRDEFLYFAMGDHLDLFGMQFPPIIALVARSSRAVFGDSVWAARVPAAAGGAMLTAVLLMFIRRLGGGWRSVVMAWVALVASPLLVRTSVLMQPVIFDLLWATVAIAALSLAAHEKAPRWWLLVGTALGLGALTKFSVAFTGISIATTTLLVPILRRQLTTRWPWVAVLIAALLSVPSITGQVLHDWPFLQQMNTLRAGQLNRVGPQEFLSGQLLMLATAIICVFSAVVDALRERAAVRVPLIAGACLVGLMLVLHGKPYYAGPAYPVLLACGALALERLMYSRPSLGRAAAATSAAVMFVGAVVLWPLGVPTLAPEATIRYTARLGIAEAVRTNQGVVLQLPQDFADMLGWRALSDSVGAVVHRLPAAQREDFTIVGNNYGRAGALAFYRHRANIPYAVSTSGDFFAWGPGTASGNNIIVVGAPDDGDDLKQLFASVERLKELRNPLGVPEEQQVTVFYAQQARVPIRTVWPTLGPNW